MQLIKNNNQMIANFSVKNEKTSPTSFTNFQIAPDLLPFIILFLEKYNQWQRDLLK